jgi:hypothetical protein
MNEEKICSWGSGFASNIPPDYWVDQYCFYNKELLENILKEFDIQDRSGIMTIKVEDKQLNKE